MIKQYLLVLVDITAQLLSFAIFVRIVMSWLRTSPHSNRLLRLVYEVTEPVLGFFRRYIPPIGMLDISPIVALVVIDFLSGILQKIITRLPL